MQYTKVLVLAIVVTLLPLLNAQTCDDVTCCPGRVCDDSRRDGPRCVRASSCADVVCPSGTSCDERSVRCVASCDDVRCPSYLQCMQSGSIAVCGLASDCNDVVCPSGTTCTERVYDGSTVAACLGSTCDTVDCGTDTCVNITSDEDRSISRSDSISKSDSDSDTIGDSIPGGDQSVVICLPQCSDAVCPFGMVCNEEDQFLVCRPPGSCDDLSCPVGTTCEETECSASTKPFGKKRSKRQKSKSGSKSAAGLRTLVRCVV